MVVMRAKVFAWFAGQTGKSLLLPPLPQPARAVSSRGALKASHEGVPVSQGMSIGPEAIDELAAFYEVTPATVQGWQRRGAPLDNQEALARWVMDEPAIFEGYGRTQRVVDRIASWTWLKEEDPAFWAEIQEAVRGWVRSPHFHAYWEKMAAG